MLINIDERIFVNETTSNIIKYAKELLGGYIVNTYIEKNIEEDNNIVYDVVIVADIDWNTLRKASYRIAVKICEWQKKWSAYEVEIYGRSIFYSIVPSDDDVILDAIH